MSMCGFDREREFRPALFFRRARFLPKLTCPATVKHSRMPTIYATGPLNLGEIATYPLASRKSKVSVADFARPPAANRSPARWLDTLPKILAAQDLRALLAAIHAAKRARRALL